MFNKKIKFYSLKIIYSIISVLNYVFVGKFNLLKRKLILGSIIVGLATVIYGCKKDDGVTSCYMPPPKPPKDTTNLSTCYKVAYNAKNSKDTIQSDSLKNNKIKDNH